MRRHTPPPLPIKDGLNPSKIVVPRDARPCTAFELLNTVVAGQRHRHPKDGPALVAERFDKGEVRSQRGDVLSPEGIIQPGSVIWFYRIPAPEIPLDASLEIVDETDDLLVVDKPSLMSVTPRGAHITQTALVLARRATGNSEISPIHRLDRLTSGILVFSKTREHRSFYQNQFATRGVSKTYEAIAGVNDELIKALSHSPATIEMRLEKTVGTLQTAVVDGPANATTHILRADELTNDVAAEICRNYGKLTTRLAIYTLKPQTGRTHQLRVVMSELAGGIIGDPLYPKIVGDKTNALGEKPLLLRAVSLSMRSPFGSQLTWTVPGLNRPKLNIKPER